MFYASNFVTVPDYSVDALSMWSRMVTPFAVADRFGYLNRFSPWDLAADATLARPAGEPGAKLSDLMDARAQKLLRYADGRDIVVLWSGGVDSTAVLVALLKAIHQLKRIVLVFTNQSIQEYPELFADYVDSGMQMEWFDPSKESIFNVFLRHPDALITHGWGGDRLFSTFLKSNHPMDYDKPWKDGLVDYWNEVGKVPTKSVFDRNIAIYEQYAQKVSEPMVTFGEFVWLGGFALAFTRCMYAVPMTIVDDSMRGNVHGFFDDPAIQYYALENRCKYTRALSLLEYKEELKDYIIEYTGQGYYRYKSKQPFGTADMPWRLADWLCIVDDEEGYRFWRLQKPLECGTCYKRIPGVKRILEDYAKIDGVV